MDLVRCDFQSSGRSSSSTIWMTFVMCSPGRIGTHLSVTPRPVSYRIPISLALSSYNLGLESSLIPYILQRSQMYLTPRSWKLEPRCLPCRSVRYNRRSDKTYASKRSAAKGATIPQILRKSNDEMVGRPHTIPITMSDFRSSSDYTNDKQFGK